MDISLHVVKDTFGPALLERMPADWKVPLSFVFTGSPGDRFPHQITDLAGVRVIV